MPHLGAFRQLIEQGGGGDGEVDFFLLHLRQEQGRIQGVVQHQRAAEHGGGVQEAAHRRHIDQWEGV